MLCNVLKILWHHLIMVSLSTLRQTIENCAVSCFYNNMEKSTCRIHMALFSVEIKGVHHI